MRRAFGDDDEEEEAMAPPRGGLGVARGLAPGLAGRNPAAAFVRPAVQTQQTQQTEKRGGIGGTTFGEESADDVSVLYESYALHAGVDGLSDDCRRQRRARGAESRRARSGV
jgi:hypothetical protein